jgi:hypothetical protein
VWEEDGHRLNLYINAYLNVPVFDYRLKEYVAAALNQVAAELRTEASKERELVLRQHVTMLQEQEMAPLVPEEEKEVGRDEKLQAKVEK